MKVPLPGTRLPIRRGAVEYTSGTEADHEAVYQTLLHVFQGPDRDSFLGALSDPAYEPDQRLLVKVDGRVVSHVHLSNRTIRYGAETLPLNGILWVGTLAEYRGLGYAQNLIRLADDQASRNGAVVQALTTGMPQFYLPLGWGICGHQTVGVIRSRNLPATGDGLLEGRGGNWQVRPWRQVELSDLMDLYERQYATTTGSIVRSEDYWRWIIGRKLAHVIWVACQGEAVRGYAFVKDHRVLELAADPNHPQALRVLLGRVRAEALERAYPEVHVHAPIEHPAIEVVRQASGRVEHSAEWDGSWSMYHLPDPGRFLEAVLPELKRRVQSSGAIQPLELGLTVGDQRWLIHIGKKARLEPDKLSRRHLTLSPSAFARLALGHHGIDEAVDEDRIEASTTTAVDAARVLFPPQAVFRSPLDGGTA